MSAQTPHQQPPRDFPERDDDDEMLDPADAEEEIVDDDDAAMDSGDEDNDEANLDPSETLEEIALQNDSTAHFDAHTDSIFCIAQHPIHSSIVATGGGDDTGYVFDGTPPRRPLLPSSYESNPQPVERESIKPLFKLEGHTESLNAITYTLPKGAYLATGTLDGALRVWATDQPGLRYKFLAEAKEVDEINWLAPCPHPSHPNVLALGAADGSVWVYSLNIADKASPLTILQTYYKHTAPCTAGAWTPDGTLLATVAEDSSLEVWDVFSDAAAAGIASPDSQSVVSLNGTDERFRVDGGLYSVAVAPTGAFLATGGAEGQLRIVGLPRLSAGTTTGTGQTGQILASLQTQSDGIETLSFSSPPLNLLAAGSVDGSIALFDHAHRFAVRRHIRDAHDGEAVIKVEFLVHGNQTYILTSAGNDGVIRRWDARGGTAAAGNGLLAEWRGHRGGGEGGGVLGFVQGAGAVVTAGDDGVALVFEGGR
ncbi:WD40 repeat-like protein [Patellaria atrata CBS 101060]|uniref:WD40 repeat-like protein n=1 Tax=Patellaria atrata CBS 101060 TaxID=1346257 RepID=A0A9P4S3U3_9PEZI|nr:WD40 repeat-like protein [Patellaria atrata CBS 101060]